MLQALTLGRTVRVRASSPTSTQLSSPPLIRTATEGLLYNFRMFQVTKEIYFCYGHRLLNYDGKCKYLHGHNGRAIITVESATLDERGMVLDFSDIKRVVSAWIDEQLDHRMLLQRTDPPLQSLGPDACSRRPGRR